MPGDEDADHLVELPEAGRPHTLAALDGRADFADLRLGWNELGLGVQVTVTGKSQPPAGDADRPRTSDGLTLWIDTRDARASHRASRYCHQFHFLPSGGGPDKDEPAFAQTKINRALQDAPRRGIGWRRSCRPPYSPDSTRSSTRGSASSTTCGTPSWATSSCPSGTSSRSATTRRCGSRWIW
jgi:hypothetical protein